MDLATRVIAAIVLSLAALTAAWDVMVIFGPFGGDTVSACMARWDASSKRLIGLLLAAVWFHVFSER